LVNSSTSNDDTDALVKNLTNAINADVFRVTGDEFGPEMAIAMVSDAIKGFVDESSMDRGGFDDITDTMMDRVSGFYDTMTGRASNFFDSTLGGIMGETLDTITNGQLSIISNMGVSMASSVGKMKDAVGSLYDGISNDVNSVFAEEKDQLIDPAMDAAKGVGGAFGVITEPDDVAEESRNILDDILKTQESQLSATEKQRLRDARAEKEDGIGDWLDDVVEKIGMALFGIGVVIGGLVSAIIKPFQVLAKGAQLLGNMMGIFSLGKLGAFFNTIKTFASGLMTAGKTMKFIGPLLKGFSLGFKFLGWPIQVLMGAIDFIKGFMGSNESTFLGKVKDGLKSAIMGFFELPLKLIGWIFDKALGLIGIESSGSGKKLVDFFSKAIDLIFDPIVSVANLIIDFVGGIFGNIWEVTKSTFAIFGNIFGALWNLLTGDLSGFADNMKAIWGNVKNILSNLIDGLFSYLTLPFRLIGAYFKTQWESIKDFLGSFAIFDPIIEMFGKIGEFIGKVTDWVKGKLSSIPLIGNLFKDEKTKKAEAVEADRSRFDELVTENKTIDQDIKALRLAGPDDGGLFGKSNANKIKDLQKKKDVVNEEMDVVGKRVHKNDVDDTGLDDYIQRQMDKNDEIFGPTSNIHKKEQDKILTAFAPIITPVSPTEKDPGFLGSITGMAGNFVDQYKALSDDSPPNTMAMSIPPAMRVGDAADAVGVAKNKQVARQIDQAKKIELSIEKMNNQSKVTSERPIVVNTGEGEQKMIEPPTDIESMSILWLNKSWGLG
jgi:hypothetical protein